MIFYKLPKITKKLQRLCGRLKTLIKLASFKARYVVQILDTEEKIAYLEKLRKNFSVTKGVKPSNTEKKTVKQLGHIPPKKLAEDFKTYLEFQEAKLFQFLEKCEIKVALSEIFDDCLSVLTEKGHIQLGIEGWQIRLSENSMILTTRFMDLAVESLMHQEDRISAWE